MESAVEPRAVVAEFMKTPRGKMVTVIVALVALLVGWRFIQVLSGKARPTGRGGGTSRTVVVDQVRRGELRFDYEIVGNVESTQTVDVVARTAGVLEELPLLEGDEVKKGDLLARIDDAQALAAFYKFKGDLANARFTYHQLLSQRELTEVQASSGVAIAAAELDAARAGLEKSRSVYKATLTQGQSSVAQSQANLEKVKATLRQAVVDYNQSKTAYDRMLGLQRQGFVSRADLQDSYAEVLSKHAAVDAQRAEVAAAERAVINSREQARKDSVSARADILTSETRQTSASAALAEARAGTSKSLSFEQQLLAQKSLVEAAEAELKGAELALEDTTIESPITGFVSDRRLDPGAVAHVGDVIMTVQAGGEVWVVAALPQEVYSYVHKDTPCKVRVDGLRGRLFDAFIYRKDSAVDAASRQFNIRVKIEDAEGEVKPGMFARVLLSLGPDGPRLLAPSAALSRRDDEARTGIVYKVVEGKVQRTEVKFGPNDGPNTLITEGLQEGDLVVVQTAVPLKDGQEVKAERAKAKPAPEETP